MIEFSVVKEFVNDCVNEFTGLDTASEKQLNHLVTHLHPLISNLVYYETNKAMAANKVLVTYKLANAVEEDMFIKLHDILSL
jgi:hypothetical protein